MSYRKTKRVISKRASYQFFNNWALKLLLLTFSKFLNWFRITPVVFFFTNQGKFKTGPQNSFILMILYITYGSAKSTFISTPILFYQSALIIKITFLERNHMIEIQVFFYLCVVMALIVQITFNICNLTYRKVSLFSASLIQMRR